MVACESAEQMAKALNCTVWLGRLCTAEYHWVATSPSVVLLSCPEESKGPLARMRLSGQLYSITPPPRARCPAGHLTVITPVLRPAIENEATFTVASELTEHRAKALTGAGSETGFETPAYHWVATSPSTVFCAAVVGLIGGLIVESRGPLA